MSTPRTVRITELSAHLGDPVVVRAWVTHSRSSGRVGFAALRDGTGVAQAVFVKAEIGEGLWSEFSALTTETSVEIVGAPRRNPRDPGVLDIGVTALRILGASAADYPLQPKEHGVDFLLNHRHFWLRSP